MRYEMFLYKTTAFFKDAPCINIINRAISKNSKNDWEGNGADGCMVSFNAEDIKCEIIERLTANGNSLCKAEVRYSPIHKIAYIYVITSYEIAKTVLNEVNYVSVNHELVLYDAEMERTFYTTDLYCKKYSMMRLRAQKINLLIQQSQKPILHLRRLDITNGKRIKSCSYVVTLRKNNEPFKSRVQNFYELLCSNLIEGEELFTENKCFAICGYGYEITYCLEAYGKCADKIGYIEDGTANYELIRRTPYEVALKQCAALGRLESSDVYDRMRLTEWLRKYPNPAERFVASVNLAKRFRREALGISLSCIGSYGAEVVFRVVEDKYNTDDSFEISMLRLEEETASFVLPIVEIFYPYIYQRYYLTENHIPREMMGDILNKIDEIKALIVKDLYNDKIASIIEKFDLYALVRKSDDDSQSYYNAEDYEMMTNDRMKFIYENRYRIAKIYDVFSSWAQEQLESYDMDMMFNIQGP